MNREIKFRAWHKPYGYIVRPEVLNDLLDGKSIYVSKPVFKGIDKELEYKKMDVMKYIPPINIFTHKDFIIMQYTGLNDKNVVEIYEGDIYHQGDKNILYKVIFKDGYFIGNQIGNKSLSGLNHFLSNIEVIGNIYENPELLKEDNI